MIDDTPEVRWSNAWWRIAFLGIMLPIFFLGLVVVGMVRSEGYLIGRQALGRLSFEVVQGARAQAMWIAYGGAAIASFGYGYARNHPRLDALSGILVAVGLLTAAGCTAWAALYGII